MNDTAAQSMAGLAIIAALLAHMRKAGTLIPKDADALLNDATSLLRSINPSFNDVSGASVLLARVRRIVEQPGKPTA
jgi:hypothetical protein